MPDPARQIVDFLLDHKTALHQKRAVLKWYGTSCVAVQALLETIPPDDIYQRRAFWFIYDELIKPTRRRMRVQ